MSCYRKGSCGPYEMYSCLECPASKPEYANRYTNQKAVANVKQNFKGALNMEKYINQIVAIDTILSNPPDAHYPVWFAEQIANLPAADVVEVVHGVWIEYKIPNIICCSECDWGTGVEEKTFKYCPNCGAKMDGGK